VAVSVVVVTGSGGVRVVGVVGVFGVATEV